MINATSHLSKHACGVLPVSVGHNQKVDVLYLNSGNFSKCFDFDSPINNKPDINCYICTISAYQACAP
jgi:hypothetical protein